MSDILAARWRFGQAMAGCQARGIAPRLALGALTGISVDFFASD
jgi:hypothetical protein